ncbi:urease accessory protein UreD, partial [Streptomyces sp. MBT58]|nr:urease accessory protein UreD [Streptomyces sp. MBT58]
DPEAAALLTALTPLAGPAVLVTAVAADARLLRAVLDEAVHELLDGPKADHRQEVR